jgi:enamine deaminase RidA (YjgF/YER057c/UK114 family)
MRRRTEPTPDKTWDSASKGVLVGDVLYLSGPGGLDDDGNVVGTDIGTQARKALDPWPGAYWAAG